MLAEPETAIFPSWPAGDERHSSNSSGAFSLQQSDYYQKVIIEQRIEGFQGRLTSVGSSGGVLVQTTSDQFDGDSEGQQNEPDGQKERAGHLGPGGHHEPQVVVRKDQRAVGQDRQDRTDDQKDPGEGEDQSGEMVAPMENGRAGRSVQGRRRRIRRKHPAGHNDATFNLLHSEPDASGQEKFRKNEDGNLKLN